MADKKKRWIFSRNKESQQAEPRAEEAPHSAAETEERSEALPERLLENDHPFVRLRELMDGFPTACIDMDFILGGSGELPFCWEKAAAAAKQHVADSRPPEGEEVPIPMDAACFVWCSRNKMEAWCIVLPPLYGGAPLTEAGFQSALEENGVTFGIHQDIAEQITSGPQYLKLAQIAQGSEPVPGQDGQMIDMVLHMSEKPSIDDTGKIDFKELNWVITAVAGQQLCEIIPPVEAIDGTDVCGGSLRAKPGRPVRSPVGKNTEYTEDGRFVLAKIDGQVTFASGKYRVDELLEIKGNVDFSTGNLDVTGSLLIHGNICQNFTVKAARDITVNGLVESATVSAGGNITILRGAIGSNRGILEAGGDIRCKFLENTIARAQGDIYVESAINSTIVSESSFYATSGRGVVIGGSVQTMNRIYALIVGNRSARPTSLTINSSGEYTIRKERLLADLSAAQSNLTAATGKLRAAERAGESNVGILQSSVNMISLKVKNLENKLDVLLEKEKCISSGRIYVDKIFAGAQLTIGYAHQVLTSDQIYCYFYANDGELIQAIR